MDSNPAESELEAESDSGVEVTDVETLTPKNAAEPAGEETANVVVPPFLFFRIVILVIMILVVHFWLEHHFGISFWGSITGGLAITMLFAVTKFVWEGFFDKGNDSWKSPIRKMAVMLMQTPTLLLMGLLIMAVGSFVSTVTVIADGEAGPTKIDLFAGKTTSIEENSTDEKDGRGTELLKVGDVKRFVRFTNPLGRPFTLHADGFQSREFDLVAFVGTKVHLKDMDQLPSVLVRIPIAKLGTSGTARIEIYNINDDQPIMVGVVSMKEGYGSVLFGRVAPLPERFYQRWEREARAAVNSDIIVDKVLSKWQKRIVNETPLVISKGSHLRAKLIDNHDRVLGSCEFTLTLGSTQDVLLEAKGN